MTSRPQGPYKIETNNIKNRTSEMEWPVRSDSIRTAKYFVTCSRKPTLNVIRYDEKTGCQQVNR